MDMNRMKHVAEKNIIERKAISIPHISIINPISDESMNEPIIPMLNSIPEKIPVYFLHTSIHNAYIVGNIGANISPEIPHNIRLINGSD